MCLKIPQSLLTSVPLNTVDAYSTSASTHSGFCSRSYGLVKVPYLLETVGENSGKTNIPRPVAHNEEADRAGYPRQLSHRDERLRARQGQTTLNSAALL